MNEAPIADERERRIFEAVMTLARSYRDDRERLVRRLSAVEHALDVLGKYASAVIRPSEAVPADLETRLRAAADVLPEVGV